MGDRIDGEIDKALQNKRQLCQVRNPHEGKSMAIGSMRVTIKAGGDETAGRFAMLEVTVPPYFSEISLHSHQQTAEAIYLTQGMLAVTLGEETMVVRQGSSILIPPQMAHRFWNPTASAATFVVYFTPAGAELFFEVLAAAALTEKLQSPSALAEIWALGMDFDYFPV